ncbi:MAG: polyphosphate polymerase domain-containing protein [Pirellulales bacterium]
MIAAYRPTSRLSTTFEVIDLGGARADLKRRKELKFTLPQADVQKLRVLLERNARRQVHNHEISTVHSVYFDDPQLSTCRANLDGLGRRIKVRLRWYDSPRPEQEFFFEIKWRENRVTGKHRFQVRASEAIGALSYQTILANLSSALPERCQSILARYCEPTVLVRYQREHFVSHDRGLRATLDYDVRYFDQRGKPFISTSFGRRHEGLVVLEGKTPVGREHDLRALLNPLGARVGRCSKYVYGCQMLGLVHV